MRDDGTIVFRWEPGQAAELFAMAPGPTPTPPLEPLPVPPALPLHVMASEGGLPFRAPRPIADLLREAGTPVVHGPVLVARAGLPVEQMLSATAYPLGAMVSLPSPPASRLPDELLRFGVGRTSANDVVADDLTVSKRHASIVRLRGERWAIVDEGSSNGTFLDGRRLAPREPATLGVYATLRFGPRARFAFLHADLFLDYLAQLRAELARKRPPLIRETPPDRAAFDGVRATASGGSYEPLAARILARVRSAPAVAAFRVTLAHLGPVELATLSEVAALVQEDPTRVLEVAGKLGEESWMTLFEREKQDRASA